jgi:hypothetical protein
MSLGGSQHYLTVWNGDSEVLPVRERKLYRCVIALWKSVFITPKKAAMNKSISVETPSCCPVVFGLYSEYLW